MITCGNLISGCLSISFALRGMLELASVMILVSALFDFFDGFSARLLKVSSAIGVDMDSLADVVSFGVAPSMILFGFLSLLMDDMPPAFSQGFGAVLPYLVFVIPALSAVRLARFNHDERQHTEFRGLATPANALFIGFLHFSARSISILNNFWVVLVLSLLFGLLLNTNLPMFSLKFKNLHLKENLVRFIFLGISVILFVIFKFGAFPIIILTYILASLISLPLKHDII